MTRPRPSCDGRTGSWPLVVASVFASVVIWSIVVLLTARVQGYQHSCDGVPPDKATRIVIEDTNPPDVGVVNNQILAILSSSKETVVAVAEFGDPAGFAWAGLIDNRPSPLPLVPFTGRWFAPDELAGREPALLVAPNSYALRDATLGGGPPIMPAVPVIGTIASPQSIEYLQPWVSADLSRLPYNIYLWSDDTTLVDQLVSFLRQYGQVDVTPPVPMTAFLLGDIYAVPMAFAGALAVLVVGVVSVDLCLTDRHRWRIARLMGATTFVATMEAIRRAAGLAFVGATTGALIATAAGRLLHMTDGSVPWPANLAAVAAPTVTSAVVVGALVASRRLSYREWLT